MSKIDRTEKKTALSINELYDIQPVGKLDNQNTSNPDLASNATQALEKLKVELDSQEYQPSRQTFLNATAYRGFTEELEKGLNHVRN